MKMYLSDLRTKISLIVAILSCWLEGSVDSVRCLKDDTVPDWYPINVYYCNDTLKPICCNDDKKFKCCEESGTVALRDQIVTWAVIFGFIALVVMIWCCYRKETHICETDNIVGKCCLRCCPCCECCCATSEGEEKDYRRNSKAAFDDVTDHFEYNGSSSSPPSTAMQATNQWDERINAYYGSRIVQWNGQVEENSCPGVDNEAFQYYPLPTNATAASGMDSGMTGKEMLAALRDRDDENLIDA